MLFIPSRKRYAKTWVQPPAASSGQSPSPIATAAGQAQPVGGQQASSAFFRLHGRHTGVYA